VVNRARQNPAISAKKQRDRGRFMGVEVRLFFMVL
jgi:hypothetical protein